jgi:hypothetical protein
VGASANAAQQQSSLSCYKCGEPGHIATNCSTGRTTMPSNSSTQQPRTAPPARGHAAAAQEGENTSSSTSSTGTGGTSNRGSSSRNAQRNGMHG